MIPTYSIIGQ